MGSFCDQKSCYPYWGFVTSPFFQTRPGAVLQTAADRCLQRPFQANNSYYYYYYYYYGPDSSVGIATDYGLDGLGSNPGGYEIFRPSRPALGPTQVPVKWVPDLSRG